MAQTQEEIREYKRQKKAQERAIEKHLVKYRAWERYPGESYHDFKRRFVSKKILVDGNEIKTSATDI